jgi:hypothetical protein
MGRGHRALATGSKGDVDATQNLVQAAVRAGPPHLVCLHRRHRPPALEKGTAMTVTRTHHYAVDPADFEELLARRATVIAAIRAAHPGLAQAQLTRQEDGTYTDIWRWDSAEQMQAALAAMPIPEARAAMSLTRDATAVDGEIIDER